MSAPSNYNGAGSADTAVLAVGDQGELERLAELVRATGLELAAAVNSLEKLPGDPPPAVVVVALDVTLPSAALELRRLRASFARSRIVIVSPAVSPIGVRRVLDAGAEGLVVQRETESSLGPTLRAVLADQACVPRAAGRQLQRPALTSREKQVLGMVTLGFANSEIAAKLFLAESTVKSHLSSAFTKLGVRSRSEAAALILDPDGALGPGILAISGESPGGGSSPSSSR